MKDEFLANTSHELRTPIHGIIGLAESIIDRAGTSLDPASHRDMGLIISSGARLGNLINDLLDFSKLKNNHIQLLPKPIDLHTLCEVVVSLTSPLTSGKQISLQNLTEDHLPYAYADEDRVQQILFNLIGNAIKFTDNGHVTVTALPADKHLKITVADTGIGIAEDKLTKIFNSFEQADGSIERSYGGTGLGLAVTKQLVELSGGNIGVESVVGLGSKFSFTLPLAENQENPPQSRDTALSTMRLSRLAPNTYRALVNHEIIQQPRLDTTQSKILIVDDEPINRQILVNQLTIRDYEVTEANGGEEALRIIKGGNKFDLVLLDLMMPNVSGLEVAEELRKHFTTNDLPIIFLTAKNQIIDLVTGFEKGANDYLVKPILKEELLARVRTQLRIVEINNNLEKKVEERTQQLHAEHEQLKKTQSQLLQSENMASLSNLVCGMAHELNNPANYIVNGVFNLSNELDAFKGILYTMAGDDMPEPVKTMFEEQFLAFHDLITPIDSGCRKIERIVNDLQMFSASQEFEFIETSLKTSIELCVKLVEPNFSDAIVFDLDCRLDEKYMCNPVRISQTLFSILTNACQAIEEKQKKNTGFQGKIRITMEETHNLVRITIEDNGCGMSKETLKHIFDPFFTTREIGTGAGLGLSISYGVIEKHNGNINIISDLGIGTTVIIDIPINRRRA